MTLTTRDFLRAFYWRLRSNRRDATHMLGVLPSFARTALDLRGRLRKVEKQQPRLAIVMLERMGDVVAAEPIARLARRRFPDAWICWFVHEPYQSLPQSYDEVDEVVPVRCLTEWMLLERLNLFDVVWNLHVNEVDCPHCCIPRNDPDVVPNLRNYMAHDSLLGAQCLAAGLPKLDDSPVLTPPAATVGTVNALALPRRFVAVHGVSRDPQREWPVDKWRELVARMLAADPQLSVVEVGMQPQVVPQDDARQRTLCGRLSPPETAEVIRRAEFYIGIDSGPAHLAHAVGTPAVILLGGHFLNFSGYMPFSGDYGNGVRATVLRAKGLVANLPVEEVFATVAARLEAVAARLAVPAEALLSY